MRERAARWVPWVTAGAGVGLAVVAALLALWSKALVKETLRRGCVERATAVADAVRRGLDDRIAEVRRTGARPDEAGAVWWLAADGAVVATEPEGAGPPPPALADAAAGLARLGPAGRPVPLALGAGPAARKATWVPGARAPARARGGAPPAGALVAWDAAALDAALLRPILAGASSGDYEASLVPRGGEAGREPSPSRNIAELPLAPPLTGTIVRVAFDDPEAVRRSLRVQTGLLGLLTGWLLVVIVGGVVLTVRGARAAASRHAAREAFLARAYHELQTPLALLRAAAETIERGALTSPEDLARAAGIVVREEGRLTRTVRRLLGLLRLEHEVNAWAPAADEVRDAAESMRGALEAGGLALALELPTGAAGAQGREAPGGLLGDAARELLANALRHAPGSPRVRLALEPAGDRLRLVCEDEGPAPAGEGVGAGARGPGAGDAPGSTGLGLALLREGLRLVGGELRLGPSALGGLRVEVEVPARAPGAAAPARRA